MNTHSEYIGTCNALLHHDPCEHNTLLSFIHVDYLISLDQVIRFYTTLYPGDGCLHDVSVHAATHLHVGPGATLQTRLHGTPATSR